MKKLIIGIFVLFLFRLQAHAAMDVSVVASSWTWSGVQCTSGTVVRIDNQIHGSAYTVPATRIGIEITQLDSTNNAWIGYDTNLSTNTDNRAAGINVGQKLKPGDVVFKGALRANAIYCQADNAATTNGVWLHVETINKE